MPEPTEGNPLAAFGANEWLVDEMYEQYQKDPSSVDPAWWDFFATYKSHAPAKTDAPASNGAVPAAPAPAAPVTPAPTPVATPSAAPTPAAVTTPAAAAPATPTAPPVPKEPTVAKAAAATEEPQHTVLRGIAAATAKNMDISLSVPTATSVRNIPVKLLWDNRIVINNHLKRARGGKVSFTHLIGYAIIKAIKTLPEMNNTFAEIDGKPNMVTPPHINLGLAIDQQKPDGTRQLVAPSIKNCESMDFAHFWTAYEEIVRKAKDNKLTMEDYSGTTISLTNVGGLGTNNSVPRLMQGQAAIIGVGSMDYPPEAQGASEETITRNAISRIMTMTSTYDHRVIQGAQSGEFLRRVHQLLLGEDGFYDDIFRSLRIPYQPIQWSVDVSHSHDEDVSKQARILELIHAYRVRGHMMADTDPLEYKQRSHPDLEVESHGLTLWDLDREFATGEFGGERRFMQLRNVLGILRDSYCRTVGIEYMHIQDPEQRRWIQQRVEQPHQKPPREEQLRILLKLNQAEAFETFLQTKFVGQKRFSLEGGETTIPLVDEICEAAAELGLDEVTIGMAHRGRLNMLANIVGKSYNQIFREFEGNIDPRTVQGSGDVKYHLGAEGEFVAGSGDKIKVSIAANPSHLETVDPILEGIARAKQDVLNRGAEYPVLPLLIHGDAAFAGQGVVAETLNLSQLRGYRTGGTIHVVVNNQVGFTTSPASSRSSLYCTDVARMVQAPIFHVNGDDPEACIRVARLAFEYRQAFNKDVVIDLVCYRRRGHNEGDDPSYTQPLMYDLIEQKRSVRKLYTESLIGRGDITVEEAEQVLLNYQQQLERVFTEVREADTKPDSWTTVPDYPDKLATGETSTAISPETMKRISDAYVSPPEGFTVHPKVLPQLQRRAAAINEGPIDWGTGEILAFGSLLMEGRPVRLAGQDSRRGTFVQRFATIIDRKNADEWTPLANLTEDQAPFHVYDSLLSEYAALGFEYGYSVARPDALVLWEAQFGDFVNGAQIVTDEYITAGQTKWGQQSGVVLLLPHGYEGQGPDHSSARIERFLQMAADDAFVVAQPSTPASHFHLLRRHALGEAHKPLIIFTPKSMLKRKEAASQPEAFTQGSFTPVAGDTVADPEKVTTVLLCSGRITWDLMVERGKRQGEDPTTAIVRIEQLYPRPVEELKAELSRFPNLRTVRWVQDEPANMGPSPHFRLNLFGQLDHPVQLISRPESSSPSVGQHSRHLEEQKALMDQAFA
ncbi:multifunctional oxoglutarate decarboxylase/oxoglutarate dehydrogenase thiamine pyrophosphate-binding subunit/dihydrolipoyllysine-residue succinyltransferase subunit [Nocardioides marmoriginsengisoli]|uniref:Multifunctional oxoglutarate decarboxylase/oxoglutarate dehydrogenase thiamine pyrophosphate-binding subunit/dihydrolipoyllysine-residue succinyltransferase subunit n=1 Tax=Nocardioides marmoriginsengisoli TaxID=661483 RepID=A0A3N0CPI0_9ACTN|nr:multifunctional oxoglutarate decarboxylase/oxoglutarate dehydrogenase thiamine pyrophosphate-binding subunit/dihydrolipoyllysine-residue succinyltransferase subunit [Nocardioides marmoriginsengisoli]RNL65270.1 multifunctional oxoglutarate decarboxylase/oxoglutarate dehydrogenase thiamine pyrophosphate-binding subunit/dihydrolipoyllysine-residue succinyltransferase subunit [Nocardioides marmoriginsengisoli]